MRYGRLLVIKRSEKKYLGQSIWLCKCDCGNIKNVKGGCLTAGQTKSCGCIRSERAEVLNRTHGMSKTHPWFVWMGLKDRCDNKKSPKYKNYGGRGITYCGEWVVFENFWKDMGVDYKKHLLEYGKKQTTLDRINNDGEYSKDNCKWSTLKEQSRNKRTNKNMFFNGKKIALSEIAEIVGIDYDLLLRRITRDGWSLNRAIVK